MHSQQENDRYISKYRAFILKKILPNEHHYKHILDNTLILYIFVTQILSEKFSVNKLLITGPDKMQ